MHSPARVEAGKSPRRLRGTARGPSKSAKPLLAAPAVLYDATATADIVEVPARTVLTLAGRGAPEGAEFQGAVGALYGVAFTVRFARKRAGRAEFKVPPLEATWFTDDPALPLLHVPRAEWRWRVSMGVPADLDEAELAAAVAAATGKKGGKLEGSAQARRVSVQRLPPARCGRVLHVGPYAAEGPSFDKIHAAIARAGFTAGRGHTEIYLNDPRRTPPGKLKTVLLIEV